MSENDLPTPPEGYYFLVSENGSYGLQAEVQLVESSSGQEVRYYPLSLSIFPDARSAVRKGMQYLIDSHLEAQGQSRKQRELRELLGIHR